MASSTLPQAPLWMQNATYPADTARMMFDAIFTGQGTIDGLEVTATTGLGIAISAGRCLVAGDEVTNQGLYLVESSSVVNLTVASVGSDRTEYVYVAINDPAVAGGRAGSDATIECGASLPANSVLLLATIALTTGTVTITGGMITDQRVDTKMRVSTGTIDPAAVGTVELEDGSVTGSKIGPAAVTASKIGTAAVGADALNGLAVTTPKIDTGAVTEAKLGAAAVTEAKLGALAVTEPKIGDLAVATGKLASLAVTEAKLANLSVSEAKLGNLAVATGKLANLAVTEAKLASQAVTADKVHSQIAVEQAASATGGWSGTVYYWRVGNMVWFSYDEYTVVRGGSGTFFTLPVGFRPKRAFNHVGINVGNPGNPDEFLGYTINSLGVCSVGSTNRGLRLHTSFIAA